jgi:hypothetical protein
MTVTHLSSYSVSIIVAIIVADVTPLPAVWSPYLAPAPIPVRRVVVIGVAPVPAAAHEPRKESKAVTEMVEMVEMIEAGKVGIKAQAAIEAAIKASRQSGGKGEREFIFHGRVARTALPSLSSTASLTAGRTFSTCGARNWPPPKPRREASLRFSPPCTTTAGRPPRARRQGAIWNRACLQIKPREMRGSGNRATVIVWPFSSGSRRPPRVYDAQQVACEHYLFLRLGEVFKVHCAVRVGVLVGANCSRKKMHQSFSFCRRVSEVS